MAFTAAEIESEAPDAWTGKPTALVYETIAAVAARLSRRGKTAFNTAEEAAQEIALLRATEDAEDAIREEFRGVPLQSGQQLLFPADGAYDGRGHYIPANTAPTEYLEGIGLMAEEISAGTYMVLAADGGAVGVLEEYTRKGGVKYRDGVDMSSLRTNHPDIWRKLKMAVPRML
jgi:hypothetical protein